MVNYPLYRSLLGVEKWFGGNVKKVMNGSRQSMIEQGQVRVPSAIRKNKACAHVLIMYRF